MAAAKKKADEEAAKKKAEEEAAAAAAEKERQAAAAAAQAAAKKKAAAALAEQDLKAKADVDASQNSDTSLNTASTVDPADNKGKRVEDTIREREDKRKLFEQLTEHAKQLKEQLDSEQLTGQPNQTAGGGWLSEMEAIQAEKRRLKQNPSMSQVTAFKQTKALLGQRVHLISGDGHKVAALRVADHIPAVGGRFTVKQECPQREEHQQLKRVRTLKDGMIPITECNVVVGGEYPYFARRVKGVLVPMAGVLVSVAGEDCRTLSEALEGSQAGTPEGSVLFYVHKDVLHSTAHEGCSDGSVENPTPAQRVHPGCFGCFPQQPQKAAKVVAEKRRKRRRRKSKSSPPPDADGSGVSSVSSEERAYNKEVQKLYDEKIRQHYPPGTKITTAAWNRLWEESKAEALMKGLQNNKGRKRCKTEQVEFESGSGQQAATSPPSLSSSSSSPTKVQPEVSSSVLTSLSQSSTQYTAVGV